MLHFVFAVLILSLPKTGWANENLAKTVCASVLAAVGEADRLYTAGEGYAAFAAMKQRLLSQHGMPEPIARAMVEQILTFTEAHHQKYGAMFTANAGATIFSGMIQTGRSLSGEVLQTALDSSQADIERLTGGQVFDAALRLQAGVEGFAVTAPELRSVIGVVEDLNLPITVAKPTARVVYNVEQAVREVGSTLPIAELTQVAADMDILNPVAVTEVNRGPTVLISYAPSYDALADVLHEMVHVRNDVAWDLRILVAYYANHLRGKFRNIVTRLTELASSPDMQRRFRVTAKGFRLRTLDPDHRADVLEFGKAFQLTEADWYIIAQLKKAIDEFDAHTKEKQFRSRKGPGTPLLLTNENIWRHIQSIYTRRIAFFIFEILSEAEVQVLVRELNARPRPVTIKLGVESTARWQDQMFEQLLPK